MSGADQLKIGRVRDLFETAALTLLTLQRLFVTAQDILKIELLFMTQPAEFPQHVWSMKFCSHNRTLQNRHVTRVCRPSRKFPCTRSTSVMSLTKSPPRGCSLIWATQKWAAPKGMVFQPFWSYTGYRIQLILVIKQGMVSVFQPLVLRRGR